jgi:hypothetical protein
MIKITRPKVLNKQPSRPSAFSGSAYPLANLGDGKFELFTYWLYKQEIETGSWSTEYDDIQVMMATKDKARDCILYKDNIQTGVIQCKHTILDKKQLSADIFAKEIIKFVLYSIIFPNDIQLFKGSKYYIIHAVGFNDNCLKLIKAAKTRIASDPSFQTWAQHVIDTYTSLSHLTFVQIESQLKAGLKMLSVKKIDANDINKLLQGDHQLSTVDAFFQIKRVVDVNALDPVTEKLDKLSERFDKMEGLKEVDVVGRPSVLPNVDNHIPRTVIIPGDEIKEFYETNHLIFLDAVIQHQYLVLTGWGEAGKSQEMTHAASLLSGYQYDYHVFQASLGTYKGESFESLIPFIEKRPQDKLILFLDGLDEVLPEFYPLFLINLKRYIENYPQAKLVISCRSNYYISLQKQIRESSRVDFTNLKFRDLDFKEINKYLAKLKPFDNEAFFKKINSDKLGTLITTPYYLTKFSAKFKRTGSIYNNRGELFDETIADGIQSTVARRKPARPNQFESSLRKALEKISYVMESMGKNYFTESDLEVVIGDGVTIEMVKDTGSLIKPNDRSPGSWIFIHHNIQEYLVASLLKRMPSEKVLQILTFDTKLENVRPSWIHTISFLIGILDRTSTLKIQLIDLLVKSEPGLFMFFEPANLDDQLRYEIFKKIFENYKRNGKIINIQKFSPRDLARFSQTRESITYVINILSHSDSATDVGNALQVIIHYEMDDFPDLLEPLKLVLSQKISDNAILVQLKAVNAMLAHFKLNESELDILFNTLQITRDTEVRGSLIFAIHHHKAQERYAAYIFKQLSILAIEDSKVLQDNSSKRRSGREYHEIQACLRGFNTVASLLGLLGILKRQFAHFSNAIYFREVIPVALELASKHSKEDVVIKAVDEIFLKEATDLRIDSKPDNVWIKFYKEQKQVLRIFKALFEHNKGITFRNVKMLVSLADEECLQYLEDKICKNEISHDEASSFQHFAGMYSPEIVKSFNEHANRGMKLDIPKVQDHKKNEAEDNRIKADILFNRAAYIKAIESLFAKVKGKKLTNDMLHNFDIGNPQQHQRNYWLYDLFDFKDRGPRSYELGEVICTESSNWENKWISQVYQFLINHRDYIISPEQLKLIRSWCDLVYPAVSFTTNEMYISDLKFCGHSQELLLSFFLRKFRFDDFPENLYLDMLLTSKWSDVEIDVFEFVGLICPVNKIKKRVLLNMSSNLPGGQVLENHMKFIFSNKIMAAVPFLFNYLKDDSTYKWSEMLTIYIDLNGDKNVLIDLLPHLKYHFDTLVHTLYRYQHPDLESYLIAEFSNETDQKRKLELAKYLMMYQSEAAFRYYINQIKINYILEDTSSPANTLFFIKSMNLLELAYEFYELTYHSRLKSGVTSSPQYLSSTILANIALHSDNFNVFKLRTDRFIKEHSDPKEELMIKNLTYLFEQWEYEHLFKSVPTVSLREAVQSYEATVHL